MVKEKIPLKIRSFVSSLSIILFLLLTYFLLFLFAVQITTKNLGLLILITSVLMIVFFSLAMWLNPSPQEQFKDSIEKLAEKLEKGKKPHKSYKKVLFNLEKLIDLKDFGFTKQFYETFFNYMRYVLVSMIYSENEHLKRDIIKYLLELSKAKDIHQMHLSFIAMHKNIKQYREFKDVLQVYNLTNKKQQINTNPYQLIIELKAMTPPSKFERNMQKLKEYNLLPFVYIFIGIIIAKILGLDTGTIASLLSKV